MFKNLQMLYLEREEIKMSNQTLDATTFEYSVSYFNSTFEDILAGIIISVEKIIEL